MSIFFYIFVFVSNHCHRNKINNINGNHCDKNIKKQKISFCYTFTSPRTMVIIILNANIAILAVLESLDGPMIFADLISISHYFIILNIAKLPYSSVILLQ